MNHDASRFGFGDSGDIEQVVQFPYDEIDGVEAEEEIPSMTREEIEAALKTFRALVRWIWQDGKRNDNGLLLRTVIACWIFLPEVRQHNLTQIAHQFGRDKESPGRWVVDFKKSFPMVNSPHFKNTKAKTP